MEISCRVYRPRRPRESPLYSLVERHLEELLRVWPERFLRQRGPLRPVVERVLRSFPTEPAAEAGQGHEPPRRASPSWGRLIAKVYHVDPLLCTRCGKRMSVVAFVTDSAAIGQILDHLGLGSSQADKPPPPVGEILCVAEHGDGWGVPAAWD